MKEFSEELIANKIQIWLKNYISNAGLSCFVVGVSGGIDSAVTSTLCANTGFPTVVVSMPIRQETTQLIRANKHIEWLKKNFNNVEAAEINLTELFDIFEKTFIKKYNSDLAFANSRSRLRMVSLYQIAGSLSGLVVGTGNKVEDFGVGFYTKYGDGGVDVSPIADLLKSEVRLLARHFGIIEEILVAKPTDGLWGDDRSDEDQLGATYDELEWAMSYLESYKSIDYNKLNARQVEVLNIYSRFNKSNRHKMIPIPVCEIN